MSIRTIQAAISPCPNDTFIFGSWIQNPLQNLALDVAYLDIQHLNELALSENPPQMIKLSCGVLKRCRGDFAILPAGGALGYGCGPLVLKRKGEALPKKPVVATPGLNTTAMILFERYFPDDTTLLPTLFSEIEASVISGKADLGIIIHETRFSFDRLRLEKLADLGELWEKEMGLPVPLGLIAAPLASTSEEERTTMTSAIRESLMWARENNAQALEFCRKYAQDMDPKVMQSHIDLYVNDFSLDLGEHGLKALDALLA